MIKTKNPKKAFTIVELVIVIAVVAILMTIMFVGGTAISNNAKMSTIKSDLRTAEVNIKAALQDPEFVLDETQTQAKILAHLNKYMEDDMQLVVADPDDDDYKLDSDDINNCMRFTTAKKDPFGMYYVLEVEDFSTTDKDTNWLFTFKSFGKNKTNAQNSTYAAGLRFEADDVCQFVRFVNSTILSDKYLGSGNTKDTFNDIKCVNGDPATAASDLGGLLQYQRIGTSVKADGSAYAEDAQGNAAGGGAITWGTDYQGYNGVPAVVNPNP